MMRRELPGRHSPASVLAMLRDDEHPVALIGSWAGGRAVVGSRPIRTAGPPGELAAVLGEAGAANTQPVPEAAGFGGAGFSGASFGGGWIGYLGYGAATKTGPVSPSDWSAPAGPAQLPAWWFGYYDHVLVREPATGRWYFEALVTPERAAAIEERHAELASRMLAGPPEARHYDLGEFTVTPAPQAHVDAVARAVGLIRQGDMFQANITLRLDAGFTGDPLDLFCRGADALQPPYAAFLRLPGGAIASLSPELFLRRTGRQVLSSPIKGTCKRSHDASEAARQRDELTGSAKDLAENVMIVDLMRSDLGRVCAPGSVTVPRLAAAEPHPGIWHLVSDVRGELAGGRNDADLVAATFPPGSVTGAPKVRAMEVIGELEATPREAYTGAIGYRSPVAGLELNVAIRTFEFAAGRVWLGAGGGIVADSDPDAEYAECLLKSRPLIEVVGGGMGADGPLPSDAAELAALRPRPATGVFTTTRVRAGEPDGLDEHLARLAASARAVFGKELPPELGAQIGKCLAQGGSGRLRITVRPVGGPLQCRVELVTAIEEFTGIRLRPVTVPGGLGGQKWADRRLLAALVAAQGLARGEQLLLTDTDGRALETDRGNLFAVIGGVLRTPAADGSILPGVIRARVLAAAERAGLATEAGPVSLAELATATEVFVTNSVHGLVPAVSLSDPRASWRPGPVTASLRLGPADGSGGEREQPVARRSRPAKVARAGLGPRIVLIDNYDSFTWNLVHLLAVAGCRVEVVRNDEATAAEVAGLGADGVVISPGPCGPAEAGICVELVRALHGRTPLLGVCLGHEAIAVAYGGAIEEVPPVHGKATAIEHDGQGIFAGVPAGFAAGRYHSLAVDETSLPDCLTVSARTVATSTAGGLPMAIRHAEHPVDGVQFHPESILTAAGTQLVRNFLGRVAG